MTTTSAHHHVATEGDAGEILTESSPASPVVSTVIAPPATTTSMVVALTTLPLTVTGAALVGVRLSGSSVALPCPMDQFFGLACPLCGMWRGTTGLASGNVEVIINQASAIAVSVLLAAGAGVTAIAWARRRWPSARFARWFATTMTLALAVNWVVQLSRVW